MRLRRRDLRTAEESAGSQAIASGADRGEGGERRLTRRRLCEMWAAATTAEQSDADVEIERVVTEVPAGDEPVAAVPDAFVPAAVVPDGHVSVEEPEALGTPEKTGSPARRTTRRELRLAVERAERPTPAEEPVGIDEPVVAESLDPTAEAPTVGDVPASTDASVETDVPTAPVPVTAPAVPSSSDPTDLPRRTRREQREHLASRRVSTRSRRGRALHARYRPTLQTSAAAAAAAAVVVLGATMQLVGQGDAVADANLGTTSVVPTAAVPTFSTLADASSAAGEVAPELLATPGAASRADYSAAARGDARSALSCSPSVAASGARAAFDVENAAVMPMASGAYRLTSPYGQRIHPITGQASFHTGTDMAASYGTPIYAVADGVVTHAGPGIDGRSGTLVIIEHEYQGQTFETWSTHMSPSGVFVSEGDTVQAGQLIAEVGSHGNSTGPHLHLEVHVADETVEPLAFLESIGAGDPAEAC
ncbi:Membrane proteins related to metalloendopeptidases [Actinomycetales bacterium JB111]|nr:Membrane proteins related to metalloendopeptidases [Actinomycetales bacterium JB111]